MSKSPARTTRAPAWICRRTAAAAGCHHLLGHAERGEDFQRAGLDGERTRLGDPLDLPVDDPEPHAVRLQLEGERQAGRAGADDHHVDGSAAW